MSDGASAEPAVSLARPRRWGEGARRARGRVLVAVARLAGMDDLQTAPEPSDWLILIVMLLVAICYYLRRICLRLEHMVSQWAPSL